VTAIGADVVGKRELDETVLARADRLDVDSLELNLQVGEIAAAVEAGTLDRNRITGELGSLALSPTTRSDQGVTIAKLVGIGVQDLAAATTVLERVGPRDAVAPRGAPPRARVRSGTASRTCSPSALTRAMAWRSSSIPRACRRSICCVLRRRSVSSSRLISGRQQIQPPSRHAYSSSIVS
jgi:Ornithine cyclodeaminase/mu-crystallin family